MRCLFYEMHNLWLFILAVIRIYINLKYSTALKIFLNFLMDFLV